MRASRQKNNNKINIKYLGFKLVVFVVIFNCALLNGFIYAGEAGSSAFNFLNIGEGAKPVAMAEAYTALSDDVNAIYWNPAGLGRIKQEEIMASYLSYIVDINSGYFGYVKPLAVGGIGVGVIYLDYGNIEETTESDPTGSGLNAYRPYDLAIVASYGVNMSKNLSLGANIKGIYENINGYTANGVGIDVGTLYNLPIDGLTCGFTVKNLGAQTKAFVKEKHDLPLMYAFGLGYNILDKKIKLGLDLSKVRDENLNLNIGGEYNWKELFFVRMGYSSIGEDLKTGSNSDNITGFCAGLGITMGSYQFDYSFVPFNEFGDSHRISLGMKWGTVDQYKGKQKAKGQKNNNKNSKGLRLYKKGESLCKKGYYKDSIANYKKALKEGYKTASLYANMGYCYHKLGMKIAARKCYKKALKLDPENKKINKNMELLFSKK